MRWFVSRHVGAINWIKSTNTYIDRFVDHLDIEDINAGDIVYGTLPVHLAAEVCKRDARYFHLILDMPEHLRGQELDAKQLEKAHVRMQEFNIQPL
ncbi:CRISPR-associated protein Csx16 [Vibrio sp. PNB23_22_6]|uniref:CRISPR-associated protein Csx16 n=1 Tax=unclassified Vibrio TaxID=2614977 RepID=UPI000BFFF270|nr:CRISPR-associated protein Csx16 [Vibrio sp. PID17_43]PHJ42204.1 hypothetical protein AK965_06765 [Vibrio sp. PID17_43]